MLRFWCRLSFLLLLLFHHQVATAHEVRPSIFTLKFEDSRTFSLTVYTNLEALLAGIGAEHEDTDDAPTAQLYNQLRELPPQQLTQRFDEFSSQWLADMGLEFGSGTVPDMRVERLDIPPVGDIDVARESFIAMRGTVPEDAGFFVWQFPEKFGSSVLRIERPGQELQAQFFAAGAVAEQFEIGVLKDVGFIEKSIDYAAIGFTHIVPKGLDHILFVLGLFLLNTNWKPLLVQVTAFTLAHSVTLALGLYGIVNLSPAIVEPLIALSIVYVAVENLFTSTLHPWRPVIVFLFGLLHGLGFAGILTEIGLPPSDFILGLIAFNVGVELGQLAVIALAFLAVGWFINQPWYRARVVVPASLAIAAMGAWWCVERVFL